MTQMHSGMGESPTQDTPSVVVLVGRTGLDATLRLDPSIELVRVRSAPEAIAAVATESAARASGAAPTPMAVIVSEEVREQLRAHDQGDLSGMTRFTRVLRNLRPDVEVMYLGVDGASAAMVAAAARPQQTPPLTPQREAPTDAPVSPEVVVRPTHAISEPVASPAPLVMPEAVVAPAIAAPSRRDGFTHRPPPITVTSTRDTPETRQPIQGASHDVSMSTPSEESSSMTTTHMSPSTSSHAPSPGAGVGAVAGAVAGESTSSPGSSLVPALAALGAAGLLAGKAGGEDDAHVLNAGGDAPLVRSLLRGEDVREAALTLLRSRTGDDSLEIREVMSSPPSGAVSVAMASGQTLVSRRAANIETLRPQAAWLSGWLSLAQQHATLADAAFTDALTHAWNRRYFDAYLPGVLASSRESRQFVTLLLFDIDDFKKFNDRCGHDAGDEVLIEVVKTMRSLVRPSDRVCRIGGDEFAVIFHDPTGPRQIGSRHPSTVEEIAERFQQRIASHRFPALDRCEARLTISGGLATFPWDGLSAADLLKRADDLAMRSKREGKNAIVLGH